MSNTQPSDAQDVDDLQAECNQLAKLLRKENKTMPSDENALRAASRYPRGSSKYLRAYLGQHLCDLKNQLLYGSVE